MQPRITVCSRCGGMSVGWNRRYVGHRLVCKQWLRRSSIIGLAVIVATLVLGFPRPSESVPAYSVPSYTVAAPGVPDVVGSMTVSPLVAQIRSMNAFLKLHKVRETNRERLAEAIVMSAKKHELNPRLLASVMIVESRGNPYAISNQAAVGIMQIHLPTWGTTVDRENINLLKIEDNVDFGARILKDYVRRFGVSGGVRRYNGYIPGEPSWEASSQVYLTKVEQVLGTTQSPS